MKNKMMIISLLLLAVLIFSACSAKTPSADKQPNAARIVDVSTDMKKDANWFVVPKGTDKMTLQVQAENTETVLFWIAPTGTETWGERELIGYDTDGSDGWSFTWEFEERIFLDHISIQALGSDTMSTEIINVVSTE